MKIKPKDISYILLGIIVISAVTMCNIDKMNGIRIVGDEFGYWLDASVFAGKNWTDVGSLNSYYSYGYSLFLVPIIKLVSSPILAYRLGIAINVIFMIFSYLITIYIGKKIYPSIKMEILVIVSFIMQLYPTLVILSQHTVGECLQYFAYWLICLCIIKILYDNKLRYFFYLDLCLILLYIAHMRNLGVVIAGVIFQALYLLKTNKLIIKKNICILLGSLFFVLLLFFTSNVIKENMISIIYNNMNESMSSNNDYSGQMGKILSIFQGAGLQLLLQNMIGYFFYYATTTLFIFFISIFILGKHIKENISSMNHCKKINKKLYFHIFLTVSLFFQIGIASIYMIDGTRLDNLVYGRYCDQVIVPLIFYTILELKMNIVMISKKICSIMLMIYTGMGLILFSAMLFKDEIFYASVAPVMGYLSYKTNSLNSPRISLITTAIIYPILLMVLLVINHYQKKIGVLLFSIAFLWYISASFLLRETVYNNHDKYLEVNKIAENINESGKEVYFINDVKGAIQYIDYLQFHMWDNDIQVIEKSELEDISNGYAVAYKYTDVNKELQSKYKSKWECQWFEVFLIN